MQAQHLQSPTPVVAAVVAAFVAVATLVDEGLSACALLKAETELSEAEPASLSAQSSVRSIKKPQLDEIRTLTR